MRFIQIHKILLKVLFMYARTNEWMMDENTTNVQERSQRGGDRLQDQTGTKVLHTK